VNAGFSLHPVCLTTPFIFFLSFLWIFYSFYLYSLLPIDGTATKPVLRFMSLETGGTHPLAREPDIQLDKELSVNLLDVRAGVIGNQIVFVLVDLRIHNPDSDAIYLMDRKYGRMSLVSRASGMQHGMGAGRTTRHSTAKRMVKIEMERGFKGIGQMWVRAWAWAWAWVRWRRRRFFCGRNGVFTQYAASRHLYSTG
jgi:hypothetical protein